MNSNKEIFINVSAGSTRIAIVEDKVLAELHIDIADHKRMVGNIYKGKVQNVIPGMQAAFIDIGSEINSFLPFSEIGNPENLGNLSFDDDDDDNTSKQKIKTTRKFSPEKDIKINDDILVQVIKEPFAGKGPRVTTDISLPGALLVLVPNQDYIGISRKISDKYEKRRLRRIVRGFKPDNFGVILRTISEGKNEATIKKDFDKAWENWEELNSKNQKNDSPILVFNDLETPNHVIRDLFTEDVNSVLIDSKKMYNKIYSMIKEINPSQIKKIDYHRDKKFIFSKHKIDEQIQKALKAKVWLKSGAHLVIEHTEAMVVIDVNSGRFIGKKAHEQNSLKINLEASREIARQLRLRDIGGLIVIDFIDLEEEKNRKKVYNELKKELMKDRAKVSLAEFSNFGLLEMTRQRIRLDLLHTLYQDCESCLGVGLVPSKDTLLTNIESWLRKFRTKARDKRLIIYLNPELNSFFKETKSSEIRGFMWKNWMLLDFKADPELSKHEFRVFSKKRKKDVTDEV